MLAKAWSAGRGSDGGYFGLILEKSSLIIYAASLT